MKLHCQSHHEQGNIVAISLCLAAVIGIALAGCLVMVKHQLILVARSQSWNGSLVLAEAGIEDGLGMLNKYAGTETPLEAWSGAAAGENWEVHGSVYHMRRYVDSDYYDVYITNLNNQPTIRAIGTKRWELSYGGSGTVSRSVVVKTVTGSLFQGGFVAKNGASLSGNVVVGSFNSKTSTNGQFNGTEIRDMASVATTLSNVTAAVTVGGSVEIYGKIFTGPGDTVKISGNRVSIGSTNWVNAGHSGIESNWWQDDLNITVDDAPPAPTSGFVFPSQQSNTVNGTNYSTSYLLTDGNTYVVPGSLSLSSKQSIIVDGEVTVYFQQGFSMSGQSFVYITPGSSLKIFSGGPVDLSGGGVLNGTGYATNLMLYGTPTCSSIKYSGGADFIGTIYAPQAAFTATGGGNQNFNLIGSIVAESLNVNGSYQLIYDESLEKPPADATYYVYYWREVPL
jgi:hypothetical protein